MALSKHVMYDQFSKVIYTLLCLDVLSCMKQSVNMNIDWHLTLPTTDDSDDMSHLSSMTLSVICKRSVTSAHMKPLIPWAPILFIRIVIVRKLTFLKIRKS